MQPSSATGAAAPLAELVVRNSRQPGLSRSLSLPITIIGSAKGCDVQLDVETVRPIHCLIAIGPDGASVRSWSPDDTFVNDLAVHSTSLTNDDVLRIGPFEFSILLPPAADAPPAKAVAGQIFQLQELRAQLGAARADFRRERAEHEATLAQQLRDLTTDRETLDAQLTDVELNKKRLLQLRKRFIKRWKNHWRSRRVQIEGELDQLERARERYEKDRNDFAEEKRQFEDHAKVETRRIEYGWEQLRQAERSTREERVRCVGELAQQHRTLVEAEARLNVERESVRAERMRLEHHAADLRIESDGMESRVVNLRAVLLYLEEQRSRLRQALAKSTEEAAPTVEKIDPRPAELEHLAEELADQRFTLIEQINWLATARESWRIEEARLVEEMAAIAEQLRRREDIVTEHEKGAEFERDHLDRERTALRQLRERLEAWQIRLETRETQWLAESGRQLEELASRDRRLARREQALQELFHRWSDRRRQEVLALRAEHRRCEATRLSWSEQQANFETSQRAMGEREFALAAEALVLEQARQLLLNSVENPQVAEKRLERLGRHVRSVWRKKKTRLIERAAAVANERKILDDLFLQATDRIEQATVIERNVSDRTMELERSEYLTRQQAIDFAEAETHWNSQRARFQAERDVLREEIEKLAGMMLESSEPEPVPRAWAA
ncbi:MAG: FHA domain-containing protein [Planctomycetes bacterium]|nr:FHA domain-containing protein [Planctomycetota bacterium]